MWYSLNLSFRLWAVFKSLITIINCISGVHSVLHQPTSYTNQALGPLILQFNRR